VLAAGVAWARPLSEAERASLTATVEGFGAAIRKGDYARVAQIMPPKVIAAFARRAGATPDQVVAIMTRAMQEAFQGGGVEVVSFSLDLARAAHKELADGEPYVLIPSEAVIRVDARRFRERSHALALLDGGRWYLVRINGDGPLQILLDGHPEFASVKLPSGSIEALNP
jgi:hypothetical protein